MLDYAPYPVKSPTTYVPNFDTREPTGYEKDYIAVDSVEHIYDLVHSIANLYAIATQHEHQNSLDAASVSGTDNSTVTVSEMVQAIRNTLGLNTLQIAKLIGVSRASLYNHIGDKEQPKSPEKYQALYQTALSVQAAVPKGIASGLKSVMVEGNTLLGHLKNSYEDSEKIALLAKAVSEKLSSRPESRKLSIEEQKGRVHSVSTLG